MRSKPSSTTEGSLTATRETRSAPSPSPTTAPGDKALGNLWGVIWPDAPRPRIRGNTKKGVDPFDQHRAILTRSGMFQRTVDHVRTLISPDRIFIVTTRDHLEKGREEFDGWPADLLVIQPYNRETLPGMLLTLLCIQARDPDARVAIFPWNHLIAEENAFMAHVLEGIGFLEEHPDLLILLGIPPDRPETAFGWIEPAETIALRGGYRLLQVAGFQEKPDLPTAQRLYVEGGLWNSLVLLAGLRTLRHSIQTALPHLWARFQTIGGALSNAREGSALEDVYRGMRSVDISRHLLQRIPERLGVVPVKGLSHVETAGDVPVAENLSGTAEADDSLPRRERRAGPWKDVA